MSMRAIQIAKVWWLRRKVAAIWAELEDLERTREHYEASEILARQDLYEAQLRLTKAEARIANVLVRG